MLPRIAEALIEQSDSEQARKDANTERVVVTIGMLVTYGPTIFFSLFFTALNVGGSGETTGMFLVGGLFFAVTLACLMYSIHLAQARKPVRAILLGVVPVPLVVAIVYVAASIAAAVRS